MHRLHDTHTSRHSPEALYALVADVERYPEFLPWCRAVRVLERGEGFLTAEMVVGFKAIQERYTSRVLLGADLTIEVTQITGPFSHLLNRWHFHPHGTGTSIEFTLEFAFRSPLLQKLIGTLYARAVARMAEAFRTRADALYPIA